MISQAATLLIAGTAFFPASWLTLQTIWHKTDIGFQIRKKYQLSDKDCVDISIKLVSTLQAILATFCGLIVCSKCYMDVLYCTHPTIMIYAWFGCTYFIYDVTAMFYCSTLPDKHYKNASRLKNEKKVFGTLTQFCAFVYKSPVILVHHMIMAPIGFSVITYFRGVRGDFFVGVMYCMEASTPFVSFRAILSKLQMKSSLVYKINGAVMLITFPICRIFTIFYTVGLYAQQQKMEFMETFCNMHPGWLFSFMASMTPQLYWYYLMLAGLAKIVVKSRRSKRVELEPAQTVDAKNSQ